MPEERSEQKPLGKITRQKVKIYIDESGTLPDTKDKLIVLAAVASDTERTLSKIFSKLRKQIKSKERKEISEIKKIVSEKILNWKEVKRKFIEKTKKPLSEPAQAPIQL